MKKARIQQPDSLLADIAALPAFVRFDSVVGRSSRRMRGTDRHPNLVSSRSASIPPAFTLVKRASAPKR